MPVTGCTVGEFLAEVAVTCTESLCHPCRESEERADFRNPAQFFPDLMSLAISIDSTWW